MESLLEMQNLRPSERNLHLKVTPSCLGCTFKFQEHHDKELLGVGEGWFSVQEGLCGRMSLRESLRRKVCIFLQEGEIHSFPAIDAGNQ